MTALCGGGPSGSKDPTVHNLVYSAAPLAALFGLFGWGYLGDATALLGALAYDLDTFCQSDPPAQPTFTSAEASAVLAVTPGSNLTSALSKLSDLAANLVWNQFCHCTLASTPSPPAAQPQPSGLVVVQANGPCYSVQGNPQNVTTQNPSETIMLGPASGTQFSGLSGIPIADLIPIPSGVTGVRLVLNATSLTGTQSGGTSGVSFAVDGYNSSRTLIVNFGAVGGNVAGTYSNDVFASWAGVTYFNAFAQVGGGITAATFSASVEFYCNGATPNGPAAQCCPTDSSVLGLLNEIYSQVNLIQRQAVPFAYLLGSLHPNLSGADSEPLSAACIGVLIRVVNKPLNHGTLLGQPPYETELGWINWASPDGAIQREWINYDRQLSFPPVAGLFTTLDYSLMPGVTINVTEIVREP